MEETLICPVCGHHNPPEASFCQNDGVPLQGGDPEDPLVDRLVGNYRLKERIGEGGFGVVYRAEHRELKTQFAVKILHPQFSANAHVAERFRPEAAAAGRLRHENVVHIADFGQCKGIGYYYVMEYLDGMTLKEVLDAEEVFSPERLLHIADQVTSAMERVHSLNIIHRDLKPENIFLITKNNRKDHVKLVDFGIAKMMDGEGGVSLTRTGLSVGTPLYMSPEQARGQLRKLNRRSDIYSWGVILFELLTYQPPFFSENPHDVVMLQIRGAPPRLSDTHPFRTFSDELEAFFQKILAKKPEQRFGTMTEVYEAFAPLIASPEAFYDDPHAMGQLHAEPQSRSPFAFPSYEEGQDGLEHTGEQLRDVTSEEGELSSLDEIPALVAPLRDSDTPDADTAIFTPPHVEEFEMSPPLDESEEAGETVRLGASDVANIKDKSRRLAEASAFAEPDGDVLTEALTDESDDDWEGETTPAFHIPLTTTSTTSDSPDLDAGDAVANIRASASAGDTSEAVWSGQSMATDPNAIRSPLQRYWGPILGGAVVLSLAFLLWVNATPEHTSVMSGQPEPVGQRDAGMASGKAISPPEKRLVVRVPDHKQTAPEKRREVPEPQVRRVVPVAPRRIAPRRRPKRKRWYRLVVRSNPKARCYLVRHSRRKRLRRFGSTPCRLRGRFGRTYTIQLQRPGYRPAMRIWTVEDNEVWMLTLRSKKKKSNTTKRPGSGDVFNQTPNPFQDRNKPPKR
jgi:serine/threonine protein kinase